MKKLHTLTITIKIDEEKIIVEVWNQSRQFKTKEKAIFYIEALMAFNDLALSREIV
jgi:hypothetical protein